METAKFEFEIKPIPSTRIMDTLKYWANITREKTGVFVDITMSNAHESFYEDEVYRTHRSDGLEVSMPATRTYKLSGYYVPDRHHDISKWKEAVLNIANEYRQGYEYWNGSNSITVDVIFIDKNGLDLQSIKDEKTFEECIKDVKSFDVSHNVLEKHLGVDEILS